MAVAVVVWVLAWVNASNQALEPLPPGDFSGSIELRTDVFEGQWGFWALGELPVGPVLIALDEPIGAGRGDRVEVEGAIEGEPGSASGHGYRATLGVDRVISIEASTFLPHEAGRIIRETVIERLQPFDDARALLAGFLIGDTSRIEGPDVDAMRRSGLAHFVAVSGSNVALFMAILAFVAGPLALGPRRRAVVGLAGLPLYAAATRFEPSVMRASVMAGIALTGRLIGVVLEAWQLLSLAVVVLIVLDPSLTTNVGFQLSVAATAGVLVGARWPTRTKAVRALTITLGAQVAVAPLLMIHFGSVPLMSPVVNLVAGPLVAMSTTIGAIGVGGVSFMVVPAAWLADLVLELARGAARWPQLGPAGLATVIGVGLVIWLRPGIRPMAVTTAAAVVLSGVMIPEERLAPGQVVVLDVGQGDAILLHGGEGRYALVDGGPDVTVIIDKLRDYGVGSIELMVLTHVHADHATGLIGVVDMLGIDQAWASTEPHETSASRDLFDALSTRGVGIRSPTIGERLQLGVLTLTVVGPVRRYASPNDQSVVLHVRGPTGTMLLAGDIETFAQADLGNLRADVLKVPHQGGATSDAQWLSTVDAELAVISVGPNNFGHPAQWVIEILRDSGAEVRRTDEVGDVIVDLS
jgi:competence protein ComEC